MPNLEYQRAQTESYLRDFKKDLRKQGTSIRLRRSSLVKHLDKSPAQYTLQLIFELHESTDPCA